MKSLTSVGVQEAEEVVTNVLGTLSKKTGVTSDLFAGDVETVTDILATIVSSGKGTSHNQAEVGNELYPLVKMRERVRR